MMKNIIKISIAVCLFFTTFNSSFAAEEGYLGQLLDITHGVEEYQMGLQNIKNIYIRDPQTKALLLEVQKTDELLKEEIMKQYRAGKLNFNRVNGIVRAHDKFVYYTNSLFYYISVRERNPGYGSTESAILKSYRYSRIYYKKVQSLAQGKRK